MHLRTEDISIAVTVYRRLEYLESALQSAVGQTVPVRVRLYDDGCQDAAQLQRILQPFGERVEYVKNEGTLGLFGNMNTALRRSPTPWVSILHDDDRLAPDFVERILEVGPEVDRSSLFFGGTVYLSPSGHPFHSACLPAGTRWRRVTAEDFALRTWFAFPGQLVHAPTAVEAGGFPAKSVYTGDWELWFQLAMRDGAVQVEAPTGYHRSHQGADRGTTAAAKTGRKAALAGMQAKRNVARLRRSGHPITFDRKAWVNAFNPLYRDLLAYSADMPSWLLDYNRRILLLSEPASPAMRLLQGASCCFGNPVLRWAGRLQRAAIRSGRRNSQTF